MSLETQLSSLIKQSSLSINATQLRQLIGYVELLIKWNKAYNLTSVREPSDMLIKHIMDSLMVGDVLTGHSFIDVGTGPGLPGIPLAILFPDRQFFLLDSLGKRITFVRQVVFQLKLANVTPVLCRVEAYQPEQLFDGVLSRAFASLEDMITWCDHLLDTNGRFFALKGQYPHDELNQLPENVSLVKSHQIIVPKLIGERHVIELKKH